MTAPIALLTVIFADVTAGSGLDFVHDNGARGEKQYKEAIGSGVCVFDADGDDRLDVYFVNAHGPNALYRNLGGLRFEDVTAASGTADPDGWGMGAVAADPDEDGDLDLLVTNVGPNRFFVNRGDGTFEERARDAGLDDPRWGAGATFFDADGDGLLDLYVVNYVQQAEPDSNRCHGARGRILLYCHPRMYPRASDVFYRNLGGGRFEDRTREAGFGVVSGRGLGAIATDVDGDGAIDLYVANDLDPNFLFRNRGDGTFEEIGVIAGVAYSEDGREESGMGLAAADVDNDGWVDLFVTNYQNETNTLYHNAGGGLFFDRSAESGLASQSLPYLGWGAGFVDWDRDGLRDLVVVNGHTEADIAQVDQLATWRQRILLHHNLDGRRFEDVTTAAAPDLTEEHSARGAAFGDLDDDGDRDIVVSNQREAATLLENRGGEGRSWIGLRAVTAGGRDAIGTRVVVRYGDSRQAQEVQAGASYLSGNDLRVLFGLGEWRGTVEVLVGPPGEERSLGDFEIDRYHRVRVDG